jgi:hypothetical protein
MLAIRDYVLEGGEMEEEKTKNLTVGMKYFEKAMENVEPMSESELRKYEKIAPSTMYM